MSKKVGVVLFNLGGPDSTEAIKPFLFNFFMDPAIINMPLPFRWCIAKLISSKRSKGEAGEGYAELGGSSPLLKNTLQQREALEKRLSLISKEITFKVFISMRYWHPLSSQTVQDVKEFDPEHLVLLPLYPQFSTTTTGSSFKDWYRQAEHNGLTVKTSAVCCYPYQDEFIKASAERILSSYKLAMKELDENTKAKPPRILFSAHGLPESLIKKGDPYQWQCEQTAKKIMEEIDQEIDWQICYQSKVGPAKWIGPSTDEAIKQAGKEKRSIIIYPHAFVSEHIETLVEIEQEYRELAESSGVPGFYRVETVGTNETFINGLSNLAISALYGKKTGGITDRICPEGFSRCCMASAENMRKVA
jgi:ferrochelatase